MSSFQKNPRSTSYRCVHCSKSYSPGAQSDNGLRCPTCRLWQPNAPVAIVSQSSRFSQKQIKSIFVISLQKDVARWNTFLRRVRSGMGGLAGRSIKRFLGVDGSNVDVVAKIVDLSIADGDTQSKISRYFLNHPGSIGCYLSHLTLWKTLQRDYHEERYILVMEDDAFFTPNAMQNIEIAIKRAERHPWDILYIGHNHLKGRMLDSLFLRPNPNERRQGYNTGFFGYVVKIGSLPNLIKEAESFETSFVDLTIRARFGSGISALFLKTPLIQHNKNYTSSRRIIDQKKSLNLP